MPKMTIISPGPLSTIQDAGRFGYMDTGFSPNGAMDLYSMKIANLLVGNAMCDGVIEMTMMGVSVKFDATSTVAITGADMQPELNGEPTKMYAAIEVKAGDVLSLKMAKSGMRSYLAVAGGFDIPLAMGSMSTNLKCALGGFEGRKLKKGDEILLRQSVPKAHVGSRDIKPENNFENTIVVRVVLGPQDDYFTENGINTFLTSEYTVSDKSDRMGVRLDGEQIENKNGVDIISDGIATGAVQIPASGTPIIMMADRQTTGGYAKIATVISADLKNIAQAKPGTKVKFKAVREKEAVSLKKEEDKKLKKLQYELTYSVWKD
ncbi:MAG: biotin-dependent carboxyltransferase family protein [Clostridia bacterium]|nr:biotin-dependent carboxyltransferase family protein [Clostridia bacterium]